MKFLSNSFNATLAALLGATAVLPSADAVFQGDAVTSGLISDASVSLTIDKGNGQAAMTCSGTFVDLTGDAATTLVLTAGHCIRSESEVLGTDLVRTRWSGNQITGYDVLGVVEDVVYKFERSETAPIDLALLRVSVAPEMQGSIREMSVIGASDPSPAAQRTAGTWRTRS